MKMKFLKGERIGRPKVFDHSKVLKMLSQGFAPKEISHELGISEPMISKIRHKNRTLGPS